MSSEVPSKITMGFETWFKQHDGYLHPSVQIVSSPNGQCLRLRPDKEPLEPDTKIVSCPHDLTISYLNVHASRFATDRISHTSSFLSFGEADATRLFLIEQYLLGERSFWWPYISSLPHPLDYQAFDTPLWFSGRDALWLKGTNLENATRERERTLRQDHQKAVQSLFPEKEDKQRNEWSLNLFLWASTVLTSRGFPGWVLGNPDLVGPVLIPGLDIMNHDPSAKVTWNLDASKCDININEHASGGYIWNNYGPKSNEELLMGYGFCLANNPADKVLLEFSAAAISNIHTVDTDRSKTELNSTDENPSRALHGTDNPETRLSSDVNADKEVHWVKGSSFGSEMGCEFSPHFLGQCSMTVKNHRERSEAGIWASGQDLSGALFSRNELVVLCTLIMNLQKKKAKIVDNAVVTRYEPQSRRQQTASLYLAGQLRVLDSVSTTLYSTLKTYNHSNMFGVVHLEDILVLSPKALAKSFRGLLFVAFGGSQAPKKIRKLGVDECAFTLWLCGLQLLHQRKEINLDLMAPFEARIDKWFHFLEKTYGDPSEHQPQKSTHNTAVVGPQPNVCFRTQSDDDADIAKSYLKAVHLAKGEKSSSVYNDPKVTLQWIEWCRNVVREEGFRCPSPDGRAREEDDTFALFLEIEKDSPVSS